MDGAMTDAMGQSWRWRLPRWLGLGLAVLIMGTIWLFSELPRAPQVSPVPELQNLAQKAVHLVAYGALAYALACALPRGRRWLLVAAGLATAYGAIDEFHQSFVGRGAGVADVAIDALGAALAMLGLGWLERAAGR